MSPKSRKHLSVTTLVPALAGLVLAAMPLASRAGTLTVIHNFTGGGDGASPVDGLMMNAKGALFGTASSGGAAGLGAVFKIGGRGAETVLHSFQGGSDGATPNGGVIDDASGTMFGTTTVGGNSGAGTVYSLRGKTETVLYSFAGGSGDGSDPQAGLVMDASGNLYGTTCAGGASGNGTVFELVAPKSKTGAWTEKLLYSFGTGADGTAPVGRVVFDAAGNLYGTTSAGGASGYGTVFQLQPGATWKENILHSFQNADDGYTPYAGLVADAAGNFYGAATAGGSNGGGTHIRAFAVRWQLHFLRPRQRARLGRLGNVSRCAGATERRHLRDHALRRRQQRGFDLPAHPVGRKLDLRPALYLYRRQRRPLLHQQSRDEGQQAVRHDDRRRREQRRYGIRVQAVTADAGSISEGRG